MDYIYMCIQRDSLVLHHVKSALLIIKCTTVLKRF